jgi:hypothetical protein
MKCLRTGSERAGENLERPGVGRYGIDGRDDRLGRKTRVGLGHAGNDEIPPTGRAHLLDLGATLARRGKISRASAPKGVAFFTLASRTGSIKSAGLHSKMSHRAASVVRLRRSGTFATSLYTCSRDSGTPRSASNGTRAEVENMPRDAMSIRRFQR